MAISGVGGLGHLAVQYDGRGFGKSDRGVRDYSIDARLRDIEAVVDHVHGTVREKTGIDLVREVRIVGEAA